MKDFKINKKFKNSVSIICSPLNGKVFSLNKVNDPIIASKTLGDGVAISSNDDTLLSPCNGTVKLIHSNRYVIIIESEAGFDILIHIGINANDIKLKYILTNLVSVGSKVKIGDELIKFDKSILDKINHEFTVVLLVNNLDSLLGNIKIIKDDASVIAGKDVLFLAYKEDEVEKQDLDDIITELNGVVFTTNNQDSISSDIFKASINVINKSGLHARPAAFLSNMVKNYDSEVILQKGNETANAKSVIEILGLGINYNDDIELIVKGKNASSIVKEISEAFAQGLGEKDISSSKSTVSDNKELSELNQESGNNNPSEDNEQNLILLKKIQNNEKSVQGQGISIYPSFVVGNAYLIKNIEVKVPENSNLSIEKEHDRLMNAIELATSNIKNFIQEAKLHNKLSQVEIFSAHLEVISDEFLLKTAKSELQKGKTAEYSFTQAINKTKNILIQTRNSLIKERISDIKDIEQAVLNILSGKKMNSLSIPENSIIIAEDLNPSIITHFNSNVKGVILAKGSSTSHISIMMKNDGIPSIVAVGNEVLSIKEGTNIILKSKDGSFLINPSEEELQNAITQISKLEKTKQANLSRCYEPSITKDGVRVKVLGNVGDVAQSVRSIELGGEGIGLVRSEFLFMNSPSAPNEKEQLKVYQDICDATKGKEVVVRTLDVGGDKPISYINLPNEENPIMGLRGIRNYYLNKEIFYKQIRALLKVVPTGICKIMLPMVSAIEEVREVKEIVLQEKDKLGIKGQVQIGIMVEVPSVALLAKQFAKYVDFFSIGTNDLAQYIVAMDRGNSTLSKYLNNLNPALLRAISFTCKGAKDYDISVGVCGAMASELECIPILVGLGIDSLSCSPELIPDIKALIRNLNFYKCKDVATKALELDCQNEVKELVYKEFGELL